MVSMALVSIWWAPLVVMMTLVPFSTKAWAWATRLGKSMISTSMMKWCCSNFSFYVSKMV